MKLIFLGAPGAGKGTQAENVSERYGIPQISTGNIIREALRNKTPMGLMAEKALNSGGLVSDDIIIGILKERLAEDDCKNGFILDGVPRTLAQAEALDTMGITIDKVINIHVPDEEISKRLSGRRVCSSCGASYHIVYKPTEKEGICNKCGKDVIIRDDDKPETVASRLSVYHNMTAPLKDYYEKKGILYNVIGQEEVADTTALTFEAIEK